MQARMATSRDQRRRSKGNSEQTAQRTPQLTPQRTPQRDNQPHNNSIFSARPADHAHESTHQDSRQDRRRRREHRRSRDDHVTTNDHTSRSSSNASSRPPLPTSATSRDTWSASSAASSRQGSASGGGVSRDGVSKSGATPMKAPPSTVRVTKVKQKFTSAGKDKMAGIFQIDHVGYDVTLAGDTLSWAPLSGKMKNKKNKDGGLFRKLSFKSKLPVENDIMDDYSVKTKQIISVRLCKRRMAEDKPEVCVGVEVNTYRWNRNYTRMKPRTVLFAHPSEELCASWTGRLQRIVEGFTYRPKHVKLFVQTAAGEKNSSSVLEQKVEPVFEMAGVVVDIVQIQHAETMKQDVVALDSSKYDTIACMGGDGTVTALVNAMMNQAQRGQRVSVSDSSICSPALPIAIIPNGTTNSIANSLLGSVDAYTATVHIVLGNTQEVDLCSTYDREELKSFCFSSEFGFYGNVAKFRKRFKSVNGPKNLQLAIAKALTSSKFSSYNLEIQYKPTSDSRDHHTQDHRICKTDCKVCRTEKTETTFLQSMDDSGESDDDRRASKSSWKSLKGEFISAAIYSNASHCSLLAPFGKSRYGHLADGGFDLVLARHTERKQYLRHLHRNGNHKNPFDLPFIETFRCDQARIRLQASNTWQHKDYDYDEIENDMKSRNIAKPRRNESTNVEVIDDLNSDISDFESDQSDESDDAAPEVDRIKAKRNFLDNNNEESNGHTNKAYKPSLEEIDRKRRNKAEEKKGRKEKQHAIDKRTGYWSMDNVMVSETDLQFKIHKSILRVHGLGVHDKFTPQETKLQFLSVF